MWGVLLHRSPNVEKLDSQPVAKVSKGRRRGFQRRNERSVWGKRENCCGVVREGLDQGGPG